jgi:hypothetical protein
MSEVFNLDRKVNMQENIDPTGKKWEVKKVNISGSLYVAVPNPYREDFVCPKEFAGSWTQPSILQEKITIWLNRQWDKAEAAQQRAGIVATQEKLAEKLEETKITPQQSIDNLSPEVRAMVEDMNDGESEEETNESTASAPDKAEADNDSDEAQAEASKEVDYSSLTYPELLDRAKAKGITAKKKVEIIAALEGK